MKKLYLTLILSSLGSRIVGAGRQQFDKANAEGHILSTFHEHGCDL